MTLSKILKDQNWQKEHSKIHKPLDELFSAMKSLKDELFKLEINEILEKFVLIDAGLTDLKKELLKENYNGTSKEKICKMQAYLPEVLQFVDAKTPFIDLNINLAEAIEETNQNVDLIEGYKLGKYDDDTFFNLIDEIVSNLDPHFVYHFKEIKKLLQKKNLKERSIEQIYRDELLKHWDKEIKAYKRDIDKKI